MTIPEDDWRRMGQESALPPGTHLVRRTYDAPRPGWDHDHCSFCFAKFVSRDAANVLAELDVRTEGYTTTDAHERGANFEWVCLECFDDFAEEFGWVVEESGRGRYPAGSASKCHEARVIPPRVARMSCGQQT